jgi:hypothetical protein
MTIQSAGIVTALRRHVVPCAAALGCALTLILVGSSTALAEAPSFQRFSGSFTEVDPDTCEFPITNDETFTVDVQFFYDRNGNLVRSLAHIRLRGTDSANGVTLIDDADITHTFDFTTGINGDLGLQSQVRTPNGGLVAVDAGRVLSLDDGTVLFTAGRHEFLSGDLQAYCAAFGG